jgi:hypothetical protein
LIIERGESRWLLGGQFSKFFANLQYPFPNEFTLQLDAEETPKNPWPIALGGSGW